MPESMKEKNMMLKRKLQNYNKAKKLKENKSYSLYIGLAKKRQRKRCQI